MFLLLTGMSLLLIQFLCNFVNSLLGDSESKDETAARLMAADANYNDEESKRLKGQYQQKQIQKKPSVARRAGRSLMDVMRVSPPASIERRRRERMPRALELIVERQKQSELAYHQGVHEREMDVLVGGIEQGLNEYADDAEWLQKDKMDYGENNFRRIGGDRQWLNEVEKKEQFHKERVQEIIEKDLNKRLTQINYLQLLAEVGGMGVSRRIVKWRDNDVVIYDVDAQKCPLKLLTHALDYHLENIVDAANQTAERVILFPSMWSENAYDVEMSSSTSGVNAANARGNNISTSYLSTINPKWDIMAVPGSVVYGFDHVDAGSVQNLTARDGHNPNITNSGLIRYAENALDFFDELDNASTYGYNEVLLRRYAENGIAKRPDCIVTRHSVISDDAIHHAVVHDVPIVNIR